MQLLGVWLGTASAVLFAVGAVAQQEVTAETSTGGKLNLRRMLSRPAWLAGQAATLVAVALQVLALGLAPVSVVQPLLAGGLVVALGIRSVRDRRLPSANDVVGAALTAGGLALFLVFARPADVTKDRLPTTVVVVVTAVLALALIAVTSQVREGPRGALASGLAAGTALGAAAVFISGALNTLGHLGLIAALRSPSLWAAVVVGLAAEYGCQQAFSRGALAWSLPALTVADPIAAVPIALVLLGERLEPGHAAVWGSGAVVAVVGVVLLARSKEHRGAPVAGTASVTTGAA